jgi:hypothetical protein
MKFLRSKNGYAHVIKVVLLEGDEPTLPDEVLCMMADGRAREKAEDIHKKNGHPGHFGASIVKKPGKHDKTKIYAQIRINTD